MGRVKRGMLSIVQWQQGDKVDRGGSWADLMIE